jgi:hypothetical protein
MSRKAKLLARLRSKPRNFTFDEAETLLGLCDYVRTKSGKTGGSRIRYQKGTELFHMHKPHPQNELQPYVIKDLINKLKGEK